jgi:hypothetical protein
MSLKELPQLGTIHDGVNLFFFSSVELKQYHIRYDMSLLISQG